MSDDGMTRVAFHPLGVREDGGEWVVGRVDTGDFVALPREGMLAVRFLESGATVPEARQRLRAETGRDLDVAGFVHSLASMGMVSAIDGRAVASKAAVTPSFPWIKPRHVRWALNPVFHCVLLSFVVAGIVAVAAQPHIFPVWRDALWTSKGTFVLLGQAAMSWLFIFLHEMAHLVTARAAGVPGKIKLGTRLQFLVAQTDVSGIWLADRRTRMTVYLAGVVLELAIYGGCLAAMAVFGENTLLSVVVLTGLVMVADQCMVFMRTDIYFVLQDLTGCRNLYKDSIRYLRYLWARLVSREAPNPLAGFRIFEQRVLRGYTVLLVLGTCSAIALTLTVTTRVLWALLRRSMAELVDPASWLAAADAATTILIVCGVQALWAWAWWRRHGQRVRRMVRRLAGAGSEPRTAPFS